MCLIIIVLIIIIMFFWSDLGKSMLYLHPFNFSNICSGLDMIGCVLSYFEGTANIHCYTSCALTTLHCSKVTFLQCCHMKNYNPIFTNMWGVYSLLRYCVCVCVYIYIYIYIYKTTIPFIMFLRGKQVFCAHQACIYLIKNTVNTVVQIILQLLFSSLMCFKM